VVSFICNICGAFNEVENFATEPASCGCGSNVRLRALIHLLSLELFGRSLTLTEFPKLKSVRGLGMTDKEGYARILAEKFDYTNTHYDREPRLDFTESHPQLAGAYDFILSADVLEHIAPPVERALEEVSRLLQPHGFLGVTVYCNPADRMREHFPELHEYRVVPLGAANVLINRRGDGSLEIRDDLVFHGGSGATLEMREFGATELERKLLASGFRQVHFLTDNLPEIGIYFDHDVSQPLIARKEPFALGSYARAEMIDLWRAESGRANLLAAQIQAASASRWLRLGKKLGLGPNLA
jgi:SAM-dependent methyltransferase